MIQKEIYTQYGPVKLVTEHHDVTGTIWVGCYFVSFALHTFNKKLQAEQPTGRNSNQN